MPTRCETANCLTFLRLMPDHKTITGRSTLVTESICDVSLCRLYVIAYVLLRFTLVCHAVPMLSLHGIFFHTNLNLDTEDDASSKP